MSTLAQLPGRSWAATHRAAALAVSLLLLLAAVVVTGTAVLLSRHTTADVDTVPADLEYYVDTCGQAPVQTYC